MLKLPEPKRTRRTKVFPVYVDEATFLRLREMAVGNGRTYKEQVQRLINPAWWRWKHTRDGVKAREALKKVDGVKIADARGASGTMVLEPLEHRRDY